MPPALQRDHGHHQELRGYHKRCIQQRHHAEEGGRAVLHPVGQPVVAERVDKRSRGEQRKEHVGHVAARVLREEHMVVRHRQQQRRAKTGPAAQGQARHTIERGNGCHAERGAAKSHGPLVHAERHHRRFDDQRHQQMIVRRLVAADDLGERHRYRLIDGHQLVGPEIGTDPVHAECQRDECDEEQPATGCGRIEIMGLAAHRESGRP